ncbi:MAG: hypothetical protein [Myoviridae sp. ctThM1]|nr:MAG: hypothetical protein [Myoviridae sp. ctThM1]
MCYLEHLQSSKALLLYYIYRAEMVASCHSGLHTSVDVRKSTSLSTDRPLRVNSL